MTHRDADRRLLILARAGVERLFPMAAAIEVVRMPAIDYSAGRATVPPRPHIVTICIDPRSACPLEQRMLSRTFPADEPFAPASLVDMPAYVG